VPTTVAVPSGSYRLRIVKSTSSSCPTSAVTVAKTSSGGRPGDQHGHPAQRGLLLA